jgi:uncharacterized protein YdeI (YjbR/CyaY-like superfamily)
MNKLKRPIHPTPKYINDALNKDNLVELYNARPPYQRNDYIGWITRAKLPETQQKRLSQMIKELKKGDVYMKMKWRPQK